VQHLQTTNHRLPCSARTENNTPAHPVLHTHSHCRSFTQTYSCKIYE